MQEFQTQLMPFTATDKGLLGVPTPTSTVLPIRSRVVGLSLFLLMIMMATVAAQSMHTSRLSTEGVYLGQTLTELQQSDAFDLRKSKKDDVYYVNNVLVDIENGSVVGIDFIGTLSYGDEIIVKPGDKKSVICSKLTKLKQSQEGDFYCFEFSENVKIFLKFDKEESFVNGYIKKV